MAKFFSLLLVCCGLSSFSQNIDPKKIDIVRDKFGVPYIFSKTNAEAAYGLAWAQCEENFKTMQEFFAISRGMNGRLNGKSGAVTDFIGSIFEFEKIIDERFDKDISPEFHKVLSGYVQGMNAYMAAHPEQMILKNQKPITEKDILKGYIFNFLLMNHSAMDIIKVFENKMDLFKTLGNLQGAGSNAMAYSPNKTVDGKTYLVANPHQPTEGPSSFYEVAMYTEEGLNLHGATFIGGGITPVIAANQNLGWTHTTNYDDYGDVFRLTVHPRKKNFYKFDGEWKKMETKHAKLHVRIGKVIFHVSKKYYKSVYGPVFKNKDGVFAVRNNAYMRIGAAEQWYRMGLSKNFDEFWKALQLQQIPCQTVTYADKAGNIMHMNNALMPIRNENYNWRGIVPGDTSATLWSLDKMAPLEQLAYIKNPKSGSVFNCNNTPFDMTDSSENLKPENFSPTFWILNSNTLRANRYQDLIKKYPKVSFEDAKAIRDDDTYPMHNLNFRQCMNLTSLYNIDTTVHKDLAETISRLRNWNGKSTVKDTSASLMAVFGVYFSDYLGANMAPYENYFSDSSLLKILRQSRDYLLKNHGTLDVPLGQIQKVRRGDKEFPMYGGIETLACCTVGFDKDGKLKMNKGDTYIMYAKYGADGLEALRTTNYVGNSSNPLSKHYNDQMEMYVNKQPKTITMNKDEIYKNAVSVSHPE